jgi:hypothetical protein
VRGHHDWPYKRVTRQLDAAQANFRIEIPMIKIGSCMLACFSAPPVLPG